MYNQKREKSMKKRLLALAMASALLPQMVKADELSDKLNSYKNTTVVVLKTAPQVWDFIKSIPGVGNQSAVIAIDNYAIKPGYQLGLFLDDIDRIRAELSAAVTKFKSFPTIAGCTKATSTQLKDPKNAKTKASCDAIGCTSRQACLKVGIANLQEALRIFSTEFFGGATASGVKVEGIAPLILKIAQQGSVNDDIQQKVAGPLNSVINVLGDLNNLIPA
jgi:hypothetical protein